MRDELTDRFRKRFAREPHWLVRAPGRVNLIGEHTDYNGGLVLPCAIDLDTWIAAAPREDGRVRAWSRELDAQVEFRALDGPGRDAFDYVRGAFDLLAGAAPNPPGFDLAIASRVPVAAGLSSSAALGVALATLLDAALGLGRGPLGCARAAHRVERDFVGVQCGILDPFASALGRRGCALRIDCRSEAVDEVVLGDAAAFLVADSGARRALAASGYNQRVAECAAALAQARTAGLAPPRAATLRDLEDCDAQALDAALEAAPRRRLRHVVSENARVDAFAGALERGDLPSAGDHMRASQHSLRDDYEVSTAALDALCEAADALPGVFGSRLTGAGFGGCTLHLVAEEAARELAGALAAAAERRLGRRPRVWCVRAADGARMLD